MTGDQGPKTILLAILVVGSGNSSNSRRLADEAEFGDARVREVLTVREEVSFPLPPEVARAREAGRSASAHS